MNFAAINRTPIKAFPWETSVDMAIPSLDTEGTVSFYFPVKSCEGVKDEVLLPCPTDYILPQMDAAGVAAKRVAAGLVRNRSIYLWGPPGAGKDAIFAKFSQVTRTPSLIKQVIPGTDIRSWLYSRAIGPNGTYWEEGELLRALRDGYLNDKGVKVPYMVVLTDLDRADPQQVEVLRLILDTTQGRIEGPNGVVYPVLDGTRVVATANTSGAGDTTGRMASSRVMDASIKSRFDLVVQMPYLKWEEEVTIHRGRRPFLRDKLVRTDWDRKIGKIVSTVRAASHRGECTVEFGLREVQRWLSHSEDLLILGEALSHTCLKQGFETLLDDCVGEEERLVVSAMVKLYL